MPLAALHAPPLRSRLNELTPSSRATTTSPSITQLLTLKSAQRRHDCRITLRPVVPVARDQPDAGAVAPRDQPVAVMLDLTQPVRSRRRPHGEDRLTWFDEAGRSPGGTQKQQ